MTKSGPHEAVPRLAMPVHPSDHMRGPADAPVTLVEYGDFECPSCAQATASLKEVQHALGGVVRFVFRHFPIVHKHPHAQWAAEAAEAAGAQGKFWAMHDQLYVHQHLLGDEHLGLYLGHLQLDEQRFRRELTAHLNASRVRADVRGGQRSGVRGTPTFFINGERYGGSYEAEPLAAALRAAADAVRNPTI